MYSATVCQCCFGRHGVQRFGECIQLQFVSVALVDTVYRGLVSIFSYSLSVLLW